MPLSLLTADSEHYSSAPHQFPIGIEADRFNYELTITFNPQLYTIRSALDGSDAIIQQVVDWISPSGSNNIQLITVVTEYQRNRFPHFHIAISSNDELSIAFRQRVLKGIVRIAGRSTFKPTIDVDAFEDYLCKDLQRNFDLTQRIHWEQYC